MDCAINEFRAGRGGCARKLKALLDRVVRFAEGRSRWARFVAVSLAFGAQRFSIRFFCIRLNYLLIRRLFVPITDVSLR
jgi:hypothetical protein